MFPHRLARAALAAACLLPALPAAQAQTFPAKPITLVVPHSAGGTSDILARTVAADAARSLGQTIVIDNKGGANGTIAAKQVASAAPDGYMLLLATASTHGINPSLYSRISYDAVRDFKPVTLLATVPNVLVVGPNVKAASVPELIAYIKTQGDRINMGSAGAGTPGHLAGEMFKRAAALQFTHVPYKGGQPCHHRPDRRPDRLHVHHHSGRAAARQGRHLARAGGDLAAAFTRLARHSHDGGVGPGGLSGPVVAWGGGAGRDAGRGGGAVE